MRDAIQTLAKAAVNTLANRLSEVGRCQEALVAAQEAADLYRVLASKAPDAYQPDLAGSLAVLANCLKAKRRFAGALERNREAIEAYRPYFLAHPKRSCIG